MSTTESGSRTTGPGAEPPTPAIEGAYTGSWADWITGASGPPPRNSYAGSTRGHDVHNAYDDDPDDGYDEFYDDETGDYEAAEYEARHRAEHSTTDNRSAHGRSDVWTADHVSPARTGDRPSHARSSEPPRTRESEPASRYRAAHPASPVHQPSPHPASSAHQPSPHPASSAHQPSTHPTPSSREAAAHRTRTAHDSPRAQAVYDSLQDRASSDFTPPRERGSSEWGFPDERRPLKRAPHPTRSGPRFRFPATGERGWAVPVLGALAAIVVTAAIVVQIAKVGEGDDQRAKAAATTPAAAPVAGAPATTAATDQPASGLPANLCPNEAKGGTVRGNGPGSTRSGPEAILALQNRYYVDRSGKAVREMYAPDAPAPSIEQIQAGIDSIPVGTTYCVQIMPGPFDGQHIMVVTEQHPDATKRTWAPQLVITTQFGGATLISALVPMNEDTPK
ncbi:hypothetical protein [Nocardia sp. CA-145437]|uniref:hypothetical protein n=1 Tax=Nocardia sp. CA-145437 TaxID=3239980 RepID=UPI003D95E54D